MILILYSFTTLSLWMDFLKYFVLRTLNTPEKLNITNWKLRKVVFFLVLAYRPAMRIFQLALRSYSVASLPQASRSHLACFARASYGLRANENLKKKCVSIDSKCSERRKNANKKKKKKKKNKIKIVSPLTHYAQSASVEAQPYLPHVTRRVPRSVHAKFHDVLTKIVGDRRIHTDRQTSRQTVLF